MPIPEPSGDETREEFLERCMGDDVMVEEYPDTEQRSAICNSQWGEKTVMERKAFKFEVKEIDEETGVFSGYAATFSQYPDAYGDIIEPGAFSKTLQEGSRRVKILWRHDPSVPIGKPMEMREDGIGLWISGKLSLGVQKAREALALMKDGVVTELSIGYDAVKQSHSGGTRHLKEIRLWDVSPVVFAANPEALIASVKNKGESMEQKEGRILSKSSMEKVRAAYEALGALLKSAEGEKEPEKATPDPEETKEAAELERIFSELVSGREIKEAESRIEEFLAKIKS